MFHDGRVACEDVGAVTEVRRDLVQVVLTLEQVVCVKG